MSTSVYEVGRVLKLGPGWADVTIGRRVQRVTTRLTSPIFVGSYLRIVNGVGAPMQPVAPRQVAEQPH